MDSVVTRRLLVASTNAGKVAELATMLRQHGFDVHGLADHDDLPEAEEVQDTFAGNARDKARHYAALTGCTTLADDSGLVVDALDGSPGVRSARFAGTHGDDAANNARVLELLQGRDDRGARFVCAVCVVEADGRLVAETEGRVEGVLLTAPRGHGGFGYDPLFVPDEQPDDAHGAGVTVGGRTFGEMRAEEKSRLSHRGRALRALVPLLDRGPPPGGAS